MVSNKRILEGVKNEKSDEREKRLNIK